MASVWAWGRSRQCEKDPPQKRGIQVRSSQETGDTIFEVEIAEADRKLVHYVKRSGIESGP